MNRRHITHILAYIAERYGGPPYLGGHDSLGYAGLSMRLDLIGTNS